MGGAEMADAIALEKLGDRCLADTSSLVGRRHGPSEIEQPLCPEIVLELEHRWEVAPELLSQAICEAIALGAEAPGDARPFAQFDDDRIGDCKQPEATRIGAQGGGRHFGIPAVIPWPRQSEPVAKAIHLFGVDRVNREPPLDQCFDHGAVRHLDRDLDLRWPMAPLVAISQAAIAGSPSPPCLNIFSPIFRPSSFVRNA
jgi:hypothetical protein